MTVDYGPLKIYYDEWAALARDVGELAEYAGVDVSDCESPNEICALVLSEMKKRLMPEGCEWPRFEYGEPVRFKDKFMTLHGDCSEVDYITFAGGNAHELAPFGFYTFISSYGGDASVYFGGQRVKRPPILAKDGKPIEVGQTLYGGDGRAFEVVALHPGDAYDVEVDGEWHVNASGGEEPKRVKAEWLTHIPPEEPDTWEKLQRDVASALKAEHSRVKDDAGLDRRAVDLVARAKKLGGAQ